MEATPHNLSLAGDDLPGRLWARLGLGQHTQRGVLARAAILAALTWLPLGAWSLWQRNLFPGVVAEPLIQHFDVQTRCLIAIPLLVFGEAHSNYAGKWIVSNFRERGLVAEHDRERFESIVERHDGLRRSVVPWLVILSLAVVTAMTGTERHDVNFVTAVDRAHGAFGPWWYLHVSRPLFVALMLGWVWRLALWSLAHWRISRLALSLVPTHPDTALGLGFLERATLDFWPVVLALSSVIAAHWAHLVVYHNAHFVQFTVPLAAFSAFIAILLLAPMCVFIPSMVRAKRRAIREYGALIASHGRLVRERWIFHRDIGDQRVLDAPEIGPVADTLTLFNAVRSTRPSPIGRQALISVIWPVAVPMLLVMTLEVPLGELAMKVVKSLV